jgi:hypothetical protein
MPGWGMGWLLAVQHESAVIHRQVAERVDAFLAIPDLEVEMG